MKRLAVDNSRNEAMRCTWESIDKQTTIDSRKLPSAVCRDEETRPDKASPGRRRDPRRALTDTLELKLNLELGADLGGPVCYQLRLAIVLFSSTISDH